MFSKVNVNSSTLNTHIYIHASTLDLLLPRREWNLLGYTFQIPLTSSDDQSEHYKDVVEDYESAD